MARLFYIHWNQREAEDAAAALRAAGHEVRCHSSMEEHADLCSELPEALVISLDRLPSHGRAVAEWFWEAKKRRVIPLIFVGGKPEKVEATRAKFPEATFCSREALGGILCGLATPEAGRRSKSAESGAPQASDRWRPGFPVPPPVRGAGRDPGFPGCATRPSDGLTPPISPGLTRAAPPRS